jgi:hypothetical protein
LIPVKTLGLPPMGRVISRFSVPSSCAGGKRLHCFERALDARDQLHKRRFLVLPLFGLAAGKARAPAAREIGDDAHLRREREHVGIEPRVQEHLVLDLVRGCVLGPLRRHFGEAGKDADENTGRGVVH